MTCVSAVMDNTAYLYFSALAENITLIYIWINTNFEADRKAFLLSYSIDLTVPKPGHKPSDLRLV